MGSQISIHDPVVLADKFLLQLHPLNARCFDKAWPPKKLIQVYHTQSCDLAELPGKGRLARSSGTNDDYALHKSQFNLERGRHSVPHKVLGISAWVSHSRKRR